MKTGRPMFYIFALILLGCTGLMGTCVFDGGVEGDGNVVKESRAVEGFTALQAGSAFEVFLLQGEEESLTIEADQNLMQYIVTEVLYLEHIAFADDQRLLNHIFKFAHIAGELIL
jgi:hypothetical protein